MTQISMTITGSAGTLARVLAALDDSAVPVVGLGGKVPTGSPFDASLLQLGAVVTAPMPVATDANLASVHAPEPDEDDEPEADVELPFDGPVFDATNLAWDARIHATSKTKTNDGKWRKRKGVDPAVYSTIEMELRARHSGATPSPLPVAPPPMPVPVPVPIIPTEPTPPVSPVNDLAATVYQVPVAAPVSDGPYVPVAPVTVEAVAPVPLPIPAPVAPVVVAAPPSAAGVTFHDVMNWIGPKMASGLLTTDYLIQTQNEINATMNLALQSFTDMADKPDAVNLCWQIFQRDGLV